MREQRRCWCPTNSRPGRALQRARAPRPARRARSAGACRSRRCGSRSSRGSLRISCDLGAQPPAPFGVVRLRPRVAEVDLVDDREHRDLEQDRVQPRALDRDVDRRRSWSGAASTVIDLRVRAGTGPRKSTKSLLMKRSRAGSRARGSREAQRAQLARSRRGSRRRTGDRSMPGLRHLKRYSTCAPGK